MELEQQVIAARLARYAATQDARELWPQVSAATFRAAQAEIARVAAAVLAGAPSPVRLRLPPGVDAGPLGVAAFAAGMGPLLAFWCETERIAAQPPVAQLLATHLDHGRRRAARLRQELERVLAAFTERRIETVVLKGAHTALAYFPEPGTRPVADIDLLVRPHEGPAARSALADLGFTEDPTLELKGGHWTPPGGERRPRSLELAHADDPWQLDLHVSLDRMFFHGLSAGFGNPDPSGQDVWHGLSQPARVLAQPLLLAYLAFHASSHFDTILLVRIVELVLIARRDFAPQPERWAAFDALTARTGTGRFVLPALDLAEQLAPGTVDPGVRERLRASAPWRLRRLVQRRTPATAQRVYERRYETGSLWIASPAEALAYVGHVVWRGDGQRRFSVREGLTVQWQRIARLVRWVRARLRR